MNILFIGDVVGQPGRKAVAELVPALKQELKLDFVVVNGENSAAGAGITPRVANELLKSGCDAITLGDHVWDKRDELLGFLDECQVIVRPANFPEGTPGRGCCTVTNAAGQKIGVINLLGRVFMRYNVNCPFRELKACLEQLKSSGTKVIVADIHAEATSEKIALGLFIDGEITALVGTHTHVTTADEAVLSKGTAYITDTGMTGPHDSVIGQNKDAIIRRFFTSVPSRFEVAQDDIRLNGVFIEADESTGRARRIVRIQRRLS